MFRQANKLVVLERFKTSRVGYLKEVYFRLRFSKSLDFQISSLVGYLF